MDSKSFLILGHGLTAEFLVRHIQAIEPNSKIQSTSRSGAPRIEFDLNQEASWANLPKVDFLIWTFPPTPYAKVKEFFKYIQGHYKKIVVVGSTSALKNSIEGQRVDEDQELDLERERVQSEVFLKNQGAVLVLSSGIYGPGRSPLQWVRQGRVGKSERWVNMVHLEDLAQFLYQAIRLGEGGKVYIASNNNPQTWNEVISLWEKKGLVNAVGESESQKLSKRIDCSRSIKDLQVNLKFQNFADSVS